MLIINADDFGLDNDTNNAIAEAFSLGLCTSTTIMANGKAFCEAVSIARELRFLNKIGVHINLSDFYPLTSDMMDSRVFCNNDGTFNKLWRQKYKAGIYISKSLEYLLINELKAQIERCISEGITPTHIDSHTHIHTLPGICKIVCDVARKYSINKIRISRNCGFVGMTQYKILYKYLFNKKLRMKGFKTTDYFGSIDDVKALQNKYPDISKYKSIEIMCHPRKQGHDIVDLNGLPLKNQILSTLNNDLAVSYLDL